MIGSRATYEQAVLFVHGIGNQEQGDTLVRWSDALTHWLDDWGDRSTAPDGAKPPVHLTDVVLHPADGSPAHADLHLGSADERVTWLLEEVWWAGEVQTPPYARLASFTLRALPTTLFGFVGGAIRRRWLAAKASGWGGRAYHGFWLALAALLGPPLALLAAPLIAALIVLLLVAGLVPVPGVRARVLSVQRALTLTVGDSLILLASPTQRAAMTSRVIEAIRFARARGVSRITIVAHSQGAAVVEEALAESPSFVPRPRLVTLGSGITRLKELERQSSATGWLAPAFLAGAALFGWWLWALEAAGEISWAGIAAWAAGYVGAILLVSTLAVLAPRLPGGRSRVFPVALTGLLVGFIIAAVLLAGDAFFAVTVVLAGLGLGSAALQRLVFHRPAVLPETLEHRVDPWLDLYSNADPVPNGPTLTQKPGWPASVEVANVDSMLLDHVRYERERDDALALVAEFTLRDTHGPIQVSDEDRQRLDRARAGRRGRLAVLRATRWVTMLAAAAFVLRWPGDVEASGRDGYEWTARNVGVPSWWPNTVGDDTAYALGVVGVVVIALAVYVALARVWSLWNVLEARALFAAPDQASGNAGHGALTALVAGWVVVLYATLLLDDWTELGQGGSALDWVEGIATFGFVVGVVALVVAGLIRVRSGGRLLPQRSHEDSPDDSDDSDDSDHSSDDDDHRTPAPSAIPLKRPTDTGSTPTPTGGAGRESVMGLVAEPPRDAPGL